MKKVVVWAAAVAIDELATSVKCSEAEAKSAGDSKQQVLHALAKTSLMPFTAQRFCEILLNPRRFYSSPAKLAYALEKLLRVTAMNPDLTPDEFQRQMAEMAREKTDVKVTPMMAIDVDLRPPPMMMMGEGGWGIQSQQPLTVNMDVSD